jgi:hypothetical protein
MIRLTTANIIYIPLSQTQKYGAISLENLSLHVFNYPAKR